MTGSEAKDITVPGPDEREVAAFLKANPDFFTRQQALLATLELPHPCGGAVSLVEYQVAVLRDQNLHLRRRLEQLLATARDNEKLSRRLHRLTLDLLGAADLDQVFTVLYEVLEGEFAADLASLRLFAADPEGSGRVEFAGPGEASRAHCAAILAAEGPVCGRVPPDLAGFLFAERAPAVGSAVLLPLGEVARVGVLAVASRDPERYQPGMGTVFVRQLAEVAGTIISHHLQAPERP